MQRHVGWGLVVGALAFAGCSSDTSSGEAITDTTGLQEPANPACENINGDHCMVPWPSNHFLVADATTNTGRRISLPAEGTPQNVFEEPVTADLWAKADGFSPNTSIVTVFRGPLDLSNLAGEDRIEESILPTSPTVLIDAETGEWLPHVAEIDQWSRTDPERAPFYIRPIARLQHDHRYIVAIRDLKWMDGTAVPPSDYFAALRDGTPTQAPSLEARREHFESIFGDLEASGVARDNLIEAWDFSTASEENTWGELLSVRDKAFAAIGDQGLGCQIVEIEDTLTEEEAQWIARRLHGELTVPLFLASERPGASLFARDDSGDVIQNGTTTVPFTINISQEAWARFEKGQTGGPLVVFGHGMFGNQQEANGGSMMSLTSDGGWVMASIDWRGMSNVDSKDVGDTLSDVNRFPQWAERVMQGISDQLVFIRTLQTGCLSAPEFQNGDARLYDPADSYFLGISFGGILGTAVAGLTPDIERFTLQVSGINLPMTFKRSSHFGTLSLLLYTSYVPFEGDLVLHMAATQFDRFDPGIFATHLLSDPLPGSIEKHVLFQTGSFDKQVPNFSSDTAVRTMGLGVFDTSARKVYGAPSVMGPQDSAAIDFLVPDAMGWEPGTRRPEGDSPAHYEVRWQPAARMQIQRFFEPNGKALPVCGGKGC